MKRFLVLLVITIFTLCSCISSENYESSGWDVDKLAKEKRKLLDEYSTLLKDAKKNKNKIETIDKKLIKLNSILNKKTKTATLPSSKSENSYESYTYQTETDSKAYDPMNFKRDAVIEGVQTDFDEVTESISHDMTSDILEEDSYEFEFQADTTVSGDVIAETERKRLNNLVPNESFEGLDLD